jgi:hypothetical protein
MEWLKEISDRVLIWFLKMTSRFGTELTPDGRREQQMWREQRLRNLEGLTIRAQQRFAKEDVLRLAKGQAHSAKGSQS